MKTTTDDRGGGDEVQKGWIRRRRRCWTATDEMWEGRDGEMAKWVERTATASENFNRE